MHVLVRDYRCRFFRGVPGDNCPVGAAVDLGLIQIGAVKRIMDGVTFGMLLLDIADISNSPERSILQMQPMSPLWMIFSSFVLGCHRISCYSSRSKSLHVSPAP
jgi:hypothetical protein